MKKYFLAAVALICIVSVSIVMASCGSEEKTTIKTETVYYKYDAANLYYVKGQEATLASFSGELGNICAKCGVAFMVKKSNKIR